MNEKIKLLAEQSYEAATITTIDPFTQEVVTDYIDGTKLIFNKEKFAELIVKECAEVVKNQYSEDWGKWSNRMILEHFGVEE